MYKSLVDPRCLWIVKRRFAATTGLGSAQCHLLLISGRAPTKLLVSRATGRVSHVDVASAWDSKFLLERGGDTVPFRLTRNVRAYLGAGGTDGILVAAAVAAATALQADGSPTSGAIALHLREDILAAASRRTGVRAVVSLQRTLRSQYLESVVSHNLRACLERLGQMGPPSRVACGCDPQEGFRALVEEAANPTNLCRMDPPWQPWF